MQPPSMTLNRIPVGVQVRLELVIRPALGPGKLSSLHKEVGHVPTRREQVAMFPNPIAGSPDGHGTVLGASTADPQEGFLMIEHPGPDLVGIRFVLPRPRGRTRVLEPSGRFQEIVVPVRHRNREARRLCWPKKQSREEDHPKGNARDPGDSGLPLRSVRSRVRSGCHRVARVTGSWPKSNSGARRAGPRLPLTIHPAHLLNRAPCSRPPHPRRPRGTRSADTEPPVVGAWSSMAPC